MPLPYFVGCPVWTCVGWKGSVYPVGSNKSDYLKHYASKFNTVEGNTTFYGIPTLDSAKRWADQVSSEFRFVLKMPGAITHEKQLVNAGPELSLFFPVLEELAKQGCLGPTMIQLGPSFGSNHFSDLVRFLRQLPREFPMAVEVRHKDFFSEPFESRLNELLQSSNVNRVLFDSRPLYSLPPADESEKAAQKRKPKSPFRTTTTGSFPILRLIGRNDISEVAEGIKNWSGQIAEWLTQGRTPYAFMHTPDDTFAVAMAHEFHKKVQEALVAIDPNHRIDALPELENPQKQKSLF